MGILDNIRTVAQRRNEPAKTVTVSPVSFPPGVWPLGEDPVTAVTASSIACVKRCVEIKCGAMASLGLHVLRRKEEDDMQWYEDDEGSALDMLLSEKPNGRQNAYDFMWDVVYQREMYGNAYVVPVYDGGMLKSLVCVPESTGVSYDAMRGIYSVSDSYDNIFGDFHEDEIIHIKSYSEDGFMGKPFTAMAAKVMSIMRKTYEQQSSMFTPGATLRGFITGDDSASLGVGFGGTTDDQLQAVTNRIRREIKDGMSLGFLPGAMKFVPTSMTPSDLQLLDSMKFLNLEICRFFGVPPTQVFQDSNVNYKSTESSQTIFMTSTLAPLMRQLEAEFESKLLTASQRRRYRIRFNLDDYYQSDPTVQASALKTLVGGGILTANEARGKLGKRPLAGGNRLIVQGAAVPKQGSNG